MSKNSQMNKLMNQKANSQDSELITAFSSADAKCHLPSSGHSHLLGCPLVQHHLVSDGRGMQSLLLKSETQSSLPQQLLPQPLVVEGKVGRI